VQEFSTVCDSLCERIFMGNFTSWSLRKPTISVTEFGWTHMLRGVAVRAIVPVLLTLLVFRYLVIAPSLANDPITQMVAKWGNQQPVLFLAFTFVAFSALAQYWNGILQQDRGATDSGVKRAPHRDSDTRVTSRWREVTLSILFVVLAGTSALLLRENLLRFHLIQGSSMLPGLSPGDLVMVGRSSLRHAPAYLWDKSPRLLHRGDVVAFKRQGVDHGDSGWVVKRVVGLPGDRVSMQGDSPVINGWIVPHCDAGVFATVSEDHVVMGHLLVEFLDNAFYLTIQSAQLGKEQADLEVGPDELFVLGDNRPESIDSRQWNPNLEPGVALSDVEGTAHFLLARTRRDGSVDFSRAWSAGSSSLQIEGIDTTSLEQGVARCLSKRPENTHPPDVATESFALLTPVASY
jgi:signal peptidase I